MTAIIALYVDNYDGAVHEVYLEGHPHRDFWGWFFQKTGIAIDQIINYQITSKQD